MFTRRRKAHLRKQLTEARITVTGYTMGFNVDAPKLLGRYLETGLQFRANKYISLEKAKCAEDIVRRLESTYGLEHGLIRRVQVAAVHGGALYGTEIY